jgi:hypothetical protein
VFYEIGGFVTGGSHFVVNFGEPHEKLLMLTPSEKTSFSCHFRVPKDAICTVELAVVGKKPYSPVTGQWRASKVSMPTQELS